MSKSYSAIARDGNSRVMQVASNIKTEDATDTPQESPLAYTASSALTITIPSDAAEFIIKASTNIRVSEESDLASYFVVDSGIWHVIPVGRTDTIYLKGDSADGTLSFYFHVI